MKCMVVFHDGSKRDITGEDGKYWLTGDTRIRKLSKQILRVEETEESPAARKGGKRTVKKKRNDESEE